MKSESELEQIPGVGLDMARHLINLGYTTIELLKGQDPEEMYERDCILNNQKIDKCILYVYRLAVYYANNKVYDPEKLKWWNWKDKDAK